jgi:RNA polymerase sigma-70 factor (ECF subfamily)
VTAVGLATGPPTDGRPGLVHTGVSVTLPAVVTDDFATVFRDHYPRLIRALELAGADHWQAEDIAQEAFARTFGRWRQVCAGSNPPGYLFRTAFRLLGRRGLLPTSPLDEQLASPVAAADDAAALRADIEKALAVMPPRRRACVVLCWLLAVPPVEAGQALGIAAGTVRKQLELARRQLTGQLTP